MDLDKLYIRGEQARKNFEEYLRFVLNITPYKHQERWIEACQKIGDNMLGGQKIMIIAPPGGGKTTVISVGLCSWLIGKYPDEHYGLLSYADKVAWDRSIAIRDVIQSSKAYHFTFPDLIPNPQAWDKSNFRVMRKAIGDPHPTLRAGGVRSSVISYRLSGLVIDDALDVKGNDTKAQRAKAFGNWQQAIITRLVNGAFQLTIGTRLGDDDFIGQVLKAEGGEWEIIHTAALNENNKSYWPSAYPVEELKRKRDKFPALFAIQYQGDCASPNDIVLLPSGKLITYGELADRSERFSINTPTGLAMATACWSGPDPIYKIEFRSGKVIRRTPHHKLATLVRDGIRKDEPIHFEFHKINDLKVGDSIGSLSHIYFNEQSSPLEITPQVAFIVGALLGDGCIQLDDIMLVSYNDIITKQFIETLKEIKQPFTIRKSLRVGETRIGINGKDSPIWQAVRCLQLNGKVARTKSLPEESITWPKEIVTQILRGLMLTDGSIEAGDNLSSRLSFTSISESLCNWVSTVAHRLGCPGQIRKYEKKNAYMWRGYAEYSLELANLLGLQGKKNLEKLRSASRRYIKIDDLVYIDRIKCITEEGIGPTVCVSVLEGNEHVYATPFIEHNTTGGTTQIIKNIPVKDFDPKECSLKGFGEKNKQEKEAILKARDGLLIAAGVDTAFKDKETSDYSVCYVGGLDDTGRIWILDRRKDHFSLGDLVDELKDVWEEWRTFNIWIEDSAQGTPAVQTLKRDTPQIQSDTVYYTGGKHNRAHVLSKYLAEGYIVFPEFAPWLEDAHHELTHFPWTDNDDDIDALFILVDNLITQPHPSFYTKVREARMKMG